MVELIFLFVFRVLSGVKNGAGYARNTRLRVATETIMALMLGIVTVGWMREDLPGALKWLSISLGILSLIALWGVEDSFNKAINVFPADIHLYETLLTGAITAAWVLAGGNIFLIAAHVYPAMILHKGAINIGAGIPFFDTRTDDPTGRYFTIPLLKLKIRREGNPWRLFWAVVSIGFIAMALRYGWMFSIHPFKLEL